MSDWRTQAACIGYPTDWWFPSNPQEPGAQRALKMCRSCPVGDACREDALEEEAGLMFRAIVGIRGGLTQQQRRRVVVRRRRLS